MVAKLGINSDEKLAIPNKLRTSLADVGVDAFTNAAIFFASGQVPSLLKM